MPFFDDSGPRPEEERNPLWRALAVVRDQLERMMLLNLFWSVQTVPLIIAWAFPQIPAGVRLLLTLYTAIALLPATATLFAVLVQVSLGHPLDGELVQQCLREQMRPSFTKLLPLMSLFYWLAWGATIAAANQLLILDVLARLTLLLLAVTALYWGPLLVTAPELSVWGILRQSATQFWRTPAPTLLIALACLFALLLGAVSIAGLFLIVPVLVVLMQVELYRAVGGEGY